MHTCITHVDEAAVTGSLEPLLIVIIWVHIWRGGEQEEETGGERRKWRERVVRVRVRGWGWAERGDGGAGKARRERER